MKSSYKKQPASNTAAAPDRMQNVLVGPKPFFALAGAEQGGILAESSKRQTSVQTLGKPPYSDRQAIVERHVSNEELCLISMWLRAYMFWVKLLELP